jgi:hypothetical protein
MTITWAHVGAAQETKLIAAELKQKLTLQRSRPSMRLASARRDDHRRQNWSGGLTVRCESGSAFEGTPHAHSARPLTDIQPELADRLRAVARAIDDALVASAGLRAALRPPHPSFDAPLADGVRRYGDSPLLRLWLMLRALHALSIAWTGRGFAPEPEPAPASDAAS